VVGEFIPRAPNSAAGGARVPRSGGVSPLPAGASGYLVAVSPVIGWLRSSLTWLIVVHWAPAASCLIGVVSSRTATAPTHTNGCPRCVNPHALLARLLRT
jgi:hypothetical protein